MSSLRIVPLNAVPELRDTLADWLWRAFGTENSRDFFASILDSSLSGADLPLTFVALDGDRPVGTVGLWRCDLISRQDLYPWLAALYVKESARGQGLSGQLQCHVMQQAKAMGFDQLHLYAAFRDYYERFDWAYIGDGLDYPNTSVHLYRIAL